MVSVAISCFESAMCSSSMELRLEDRSRFRIITECAHKMPLFNKSSTLEFENHQKTVTLLRTIQCSLPTFLPLIRWLLFTCCWWWCLLAWEKAGWSKMFLWRCTRARPQDDIWRLNDHSDWTRSRPRARPSPRSPPQPRQLFKVNCRSGSIARAIALIYTNSRQ